MPNLAAVAALTRIRTRRSWVLVAALVVLCVPGGCSADTDTSKSDQIAAKSDEVATIVGTTAPAKPAAKGPPPQDGTVVRMDMSDAERDAMYVAYYACLKTQGVKFESYRRNGKVIKEVPKEDQKDKPAAYRTCRSKEPVVDPLLDKNQNPNYADQTRAWMSCMNKAGVPVSGNWDDEFFKIGKPRAGVDYAKTTTRCWMESYRW
jgi:hypothetical protein